MTVATYTLAPDQDALISTCTHEEAVTRNAVIDKDGKIVF
jgi:hypothetical protein